MKKQTAQGKVKTIFEISIAILLNIVKKATATVITLALLNSATVTVYSEHIKEDRYSISSELCLYRADTNSSVVNDSSQYEVLEITTQITDLINGAWDTFDYKLYIYILNDQYLSDVFCDASNSEIKSYINGITAKPDKNMPIFTISSIGKDQRKIHAVMIAVLEVLPEVIEEYSYSDGYNSYSVHGSWLTHVPHDFTSAQRGITKVPNRNEKLIAIVGICVASAFSVIRNANRIISLIYLVCFSLSKILLFRSCRTRRSRRSIQEP